jgi:hydroxypyruvate isomerase
MPRFAANLSMLFTEVPLAQRFERAARAGFRSVEVQLPYELPAQQIAGELQANRLQMVLHNLPAGDWAGGERGIACLPGREAEFREGVHQAISYAQALGVTRLNCLAGKRPEGVSPQQAQEVFVANLGHAAPLLKAAGMQLLIEPVNHFDIPGFHLGTTAQAVQTIEAVGSDNLFIQYDAYHAQRMEGELCGTVHKHLRHIAHIQVADNPGRNEPGTGEVNWPYFFAHLDRIGYRGYVGCEYKPAGRTEDGLGWLEQARRLLRASA